MSIEDIYRATKEKAQRSSPNKFDNGVAYEKFAPPPKLRWHEKTWGILLALIICFPIGVILLLQSPRHSNQFKGGIMLMCVCAFFFVLKNDSSHETNSKPRQSTVYTQSTKTTEKTIYANSQRSCLCIVNAGDIEDFLEAAHRKDVAYIESMIISGRAFAVRRNTRVLCSDSGINGGIVFVTFLEGEHKNQRAYTFAKRVH